MAEAVMLPGLFVTGTDTGVGKTYVTALIAADLMERGIRVGAYKPVCTGGVLTDSGELSWEDVERLHGVIGGRFERRRICPQCFQAPLAPPVAAAVEGGTVDRHLLRDGAFWWHGRADVLLVEGAGGLLCPLSASDTVADIAKDFGLPLVIVARNGLGTINHTLLTVEVARHRGLPLAAVVLDDGPNQTGDESTETNAGEIASRIDVPLLRLGTRARKCEPVHPLGSAHLDWLELMQRSGSP